MPDSPVRVLLIEDDSDDYVIARESLAEIEDGEYLLDWASTYDEGLAVALEGRHDVILVDYRLGDRTGVDLVTEAIRGGCTTPMIFLTGQKEREVDRAAMQAGAWDYLVKHDIDAVTLERSIRYALQRRRAEERAEHLQAREKEMAWRLQKALLIDEPPKHVEGLDIGAVSLPSRSVDGDFWAFEEYDRDHFDVIIGDVMGKGIPASLAGAGTKHHFQRCARRLILALREFSRMPDPEEIIAAVHHATSSDLYQLDTFVTLWYSRFDMATRTMTYVDAGHMRTVHYCAAERKVELLQGDNLPLGVALGEIYAQKRITFGAGDVFVFYSDGLTEARNPDGELFGEERVVQAVEESVHQPAQEMASYLCDAAKSFAVNNGLRDDLTCVVVKIATAFPPRPVAHSAMEVHSNPKELDAMRKLVEWFCRDQAPARFTEHEIATLVLAVSEATTNILDHAYWGTRHRRVQVDLHAYEDEVQVDLADWGRPFDPGAVQQPAFDGSRERGFGVYIIQQSVDSHRYYRDDLGRNHLVMVKRAMGREATGTSE